MEEYQFTCTECTQEITVNEQMQAAILDNGCPVCAAPVSGENFE
jgi:predicted nucleic acid-binding Zn ribbon protein